MQWLFEQKDSGVEENYVIKQIIAHQLALEEGKYGQNTMLSMCDVIDTSESEFTMFKTEELDKSQLLAYWSDYVPTVLQFIKADRTGDWLLHLL